MFMNADEIKKTLCKLGTHLCGIASIDRFDGAPEGFHPRDVLPSCKSVIVIAKCFPAGVLHCNTTVPYTVARNMLADMLDKISVQFCGIAERHGILAVPTGTISHSQYDGKTDRWRSIVSAKHCAVAAGLGRIGRNTLLVTPEYGNMVWISAILTDTVFSPDEMLEGDPCEEACSLCTDNCPVHALGDPAMNQNACSDYAFHTDEGEEFKFKCYRCRVICPNCLGSKNQKDSE